MIYREFGKTGEKVSVLGYGNMRLPVVNNQYDHIDQTEALRLVRHAVDMGVNYLDTSWPYHSTSLTEGGASEPFVGAALKEIGRDKVFVATKLPIWLVHERGDMDAYLDRQLARLGTDHVDFYLVHNIIRPTWERMVSLGLGDFLDRCKKSGKVRHVGFSFHDTPALFQEVIDYYDFEFCQHALNYYDVNFQAGIASMRAAARRHMGVIAMEPVMGGMLGDLLPEKAKQLLAATGVQRSPAGWALRWVWDQPEITFLLSGMSTMAQVEENCRLADEADTPLTPEEMDAYGEVMKLFREQRAIDCTGCGLCHCQYGIAIRDNFLLYNAGKILDVQYISDKNYSLMLANTGMQAEKCNACGKCDGVCPQGLNIPWELRKVARHFRQP